MYKAVDVQIVAGNTEKAFYNSLVEIRIGQPPEQVVRTMNTFLRTHLSGALCKEEECFIAHQVAGLGDFAGAFGLLQLQHFVKSLLDKAGRNVGQFKDNMPDVMWVHSFIMRHKNILPSQMCQNIVISKAPVRVGTGGVLSTYVEQVDREGQKCMKDTESTDVVKVEEEENMDTSVTRVTLEEEEDVMGCLLVETGLTKLEKQDGDDDIVNDTEYIVVPAAKDRNITQVDDGNATVSGEEHAPLENIPCNTTEARCENGLMQAEELVIDNLQIKWSLELNKETPFNTGRQGLKRKHSHHRKVVHKLKHFTQDPDAQRYMAQKIDERKDTPRMQPVGENNNSGNSMQPVVAWGTAAVQCEEKSMQIDEGKREERDLEKKEIKIAEEVLQVEEVKYDPEFLEGEDVGGSKSQVPCMEEVKCEEEFKHVEDSSDSTGGSHVMCMGNLGNDGPSRAGGSKLKQKHGRHGKVQRKLLPDPDSLTRKPDCCQESDLSVDVPSTELHCTESSSSQPNKEKNSSAQSSKQPGRGSILILSRQVLWKLRHQQLQVCQRLRAPLRPPRLYCW